MTSSKKLCINCTHTAIEKYCSNCGQKQDVGRLTWGSIFDELQQRLLGFDNNFMRTVKDLTINPKKVISASIEGVRVRYIGPVGYYFLLLTVYVLITNIFNIDVSEVNLEINAALYPEFSQEQIELINKINAFITEYHRAISFITIPFFVFGLKIMFRKKGYNFLETSVINFYGAAHPILLSIIFILVYKFTGSSYSIMAMSIISILYTVIIATLYYSGNKVWNFIKATFGMILGFVLMLVFSGFVGIVIGVLKAMGKL